MKRRNFIKGLLGMAAAPLAIVLAKEPAPKKSLIREMEKRLSGPEILPHTATDITWVRKLRMLEARMVGNNIRPFPDGLYRGKIGASVARHLLAEAPPEYLGRIGQINQGNEFQFCGFRLFVQDDDFLGIQAWGRP